MLTTRLMAAAAMALGLVARVIADADSIVLSCTDNIYADGHIYRSSTDDLGSFPVKKSFPLYLATERTQPLYSLQPAHNTESHKYTTIDEYLYINVSTGAYQPVGFVSGGNQSLGYGETTSGFYNPFGFFMWHEDFTASSKPEAVHTQGFQWVPVDDYSAITQLYWNQTQYDVAAAGGTVTSDNSNIGICNVDYTPTLAE